MTLKIYKYSANCLETGANMCDIMFIHFLANKLIRDFNRNYLFIIAVEGLWWRKKDNPYVCTNMPRKPAVLYSYDLYIFTDVIE